jgi:hypothetical protein
MRDDAQYYCYQTGIKLHKEGGGADGTTGIFPKISTRFFFGPDTRKRAYKLLHVEWHNEYLKVNVCGQERSSYLIAPSIDFRNAIILGARRTNLFMSSSGLFWDSDHRKSL